jgi:hypothetical protein
MTKKARKALIKSIEKWERYLTVAHFVDASFVWIVDACICIDNEILIDDPQTCPLCNVFNKSSLGYTSSCNRCPIYEKTGKLFCEGTPYFKISDWMLDFQNHRVDIKEGIDLIAEEVEFLYSLLDEGE